MQPGTQLGHYEIIDRLGAGGMGEVYRARDTTLDREVAVKVLPEDFSRDPSRLVRFEREAKLLASLNHPNVATIHGFDESDGVRFIAMELVEGDSLAERIAASGRIDVGEALEIARRIALALEAAHEAGVIHRDLKPANVHVAPDGTVKVLDFGLAKAYAADGSEPSSDQSHSPTMMAATGAGVIMGTAPYMSPEQARGKPVDKRTDVWAFGCVLYEMLTGIRAFDGETVSDTMAAVIRAEPDWAALPDNLSWRLVDLLHRCLVKEPRERVRDIGDCRIDLNRIIADPDAGVVSQDGGGDPQGGLLRTLAVGSLMAVVAATGTWLIAGGAGSSSVPGRGSPERVDIVLPPDAPLALGTLRPAVAISPDGSTLAYIANRGGRRQLYVRRFDDGVAVPIEGSTGGYGPFYAPDSQRLGFVSDWSIKSVPSGGGSVISHFRVSPVTRGVSWVPDGEFVFNSSPNGGLRDSSVAAEYEREDLLSSRPADGVFSYRWPDVLPNGTHALMAIDTGSGFDNSLIGVVDLRDGSVTRLLDGGTNPRYAASGHLLFVRGDALWAAAFNIETMALGSARQVVEGVATEYAGSAHYSVSARGTLVYVPGGSWLADRRLVWVGRDGDAEPLPTPHRPYSQPRLSPDGRRVAVTIPEGSNYEIWVSSVSRGNLDPLTRDPGEDFNPLWIDDGRIAFSGELHDRMQEAGPPSLYEASADGVGEPQLLLPIRLGVMVGASSWSSRSNLLALFEANMGTERTDRTVLDVAVLPLDETGEPIEFVRTDYEETGATFSPDESWIAYVSNRSGRAEVYARPFPGPGARVPVSVDGGREPIWSRDGTELFFRDGNRMMVAPFIAGAAEPWRPFRSVRPPLRANAPA
ncbi:MAG TPA: protein kinase [Acidobacteriota bacterium]|nr:protein kinase [Acidobacteriota bacterium]